LPVPRVLEIALELADALTRAHHLGIIYRDLKPANVLLAEDGTPRLTDFGIARVSDSPRPTETGLLVGTPDFLSPEACGGQTLDERTDIWAFGVLLFEMLTGEPPFPGDSLTAKLTAILTQPVPDLARRCPDAPEALVNLVYPMLEKDRERRIPSVRLVGAELEAILKGRERLAQVRLAPGENRCSTPTPPTGAPTQPQIAHNLPAQLTSFVGRMRETAEVVHLLEATRLLEAALALFRKRDYKPGITQVLIGIGEMARLDGDYERATQAYEECRAIAREEGDKMSGAKTFGNLGYVAQQRGEYARAAELLLEGLMLFRELGTRRYICQDFAGLAGPVAAQGHPEAAARLLGASEALLEAMGTGLQAGDRRDI
jgi:hypothetical protein